MEEKYGRSPTTIAASRASSAAGALAELRSLRDERSERYQKAMISVVRASMPIDGDVEFPKDWKEKTRQRKKVELTPKAAQEAGGFYGEHAAQAERLYHRYSTEQLELLLEFVRQSREFNEHHAARLERETRGR